MSELLHPEVRRLVAIGVLLAVFQQVTGINTVIYYAPTLLQHAGFGNSGALLANVGNGVVNVGLTIVAIRLLDRVGRRPLLIGGTAGMAVALAAIAVVFAAEGDQLHGASAVIAIAALALYTGSFAIGLGPVFWLLISELYPVRIRGTAMSVATIANWAANFAVTISFLTLLNAISDAGTFFLFAALTLVALAYFISRYPRPRASASSRSNPTSTLGSSNIAAPPPGCALAECGIDITLELTDRTTQPTQPTHATKRDDAIAADASSDPRRWRPLAVTQFAAFIVLLDVSIVNVALPSIERGMAVRRPPRNGSCRFTRLH